MTKRKNWQILVPIFCVSVFIACPQQPEDPYIDQTGDDPGQLTQVSMPVFSPPGGELASVPRTISFSSETEGVSFYYTIDGTAPTEASSSGVFYEVNGPLKLRVLATKEDMSDSEIATADYTVVAEPSNIATLSSIIVSSGIFYPAFSTDIYSYEVIIPSDVSSVTVTPISTGPGTTILVNGEEVASGNTGSGIAATSGTTIDLHIEAEDGIATADYNITLGTANHSTWTEQAKSGTKNMDFWTAAASSDDGVNLVVTSNSGYLYTSVDSGETWVERTDLGDQQWKAVASSANGSFIAAAYNQYIVISNNGGATWSAPHALGTENMGKIRISANGEYIYAIDYSGIPGYIYSSSDYGVTWNSLSAAEPETWNELVCSSDGSKVIVGFVSTTEGQFLVSNDFGATWTDLPVPILDQYMGSLTLSGDGTMIAYIGAAGSINVSSDSGVTWNKRNFNRSINRIVYSRDGSTLVGTRTSDPVETNESYVIISTDNGVNWTIKTQDSRHWGPMALSSNSSHMVVSPYNYLGYIRTSSDYGASWTDRKSPGRRDWCDVSLSRDGQYQAAAFSDEFGGPSMLYTSTDFGLNWTELTSAGERLWFDIAIADGGQKLAAVDKIEALYTSADGGTTWIENAGAGTSGWSSIDVSADGSTIIASERNGAVRYSKDWGNSWTTASALGTSTYWKSVAVTYDGSTMVAVKSGYVWISSDSGQTWTQSDLPYKLWTDVALSSDGKAIALAPISGGNIFTSFDGGISWTERIFSSPQKYWTGIAMSSYGHGIAAVASNGISSSTPSVPGSLYISMDGGETWTERVSAGSRKWTDVAASNDFRTLIASAHEETGIFVSR